MSNIKLPKGFKAINNGGGDAWDFKKMKTLEGVMGSVREFDSKFKKGEKQRAATITTKNGDITVFERAGLRQLFDVKKGKRVYLAYTGPKKIAGRKKPMESFVVAVA